MGHNRTQLAQPHLEIRPSRGGVFFVVFVDGGGERVVDDVANLRRVIRERAAVRYQRSVGG
jgi:hypothetical protein